MQPYLLLALLGLPQAQAIGNESLGQSYNQAHVGGGLVSEGVGLRSAIGTAGSSITISGIPSGATIEQAYLYVVQIVSSTSSYDSSFSFASSTVTGSLVGTSGDTCWGMGGNVTLRADVTSLVSGNGTYALSGVGNGSSQLGQGASLVVVYSDSSSTSTGRIIINDGAISGNSSGQSMSATLAGFTVPTGVTGGTFHMAMGDGQSFGDDPVLFEGTTVLPSNSFNGSDGGGWDDHTVSLSSSLFTPSDTSFSVTTAVGSDCLVWPYVAVSYESCTQVTWYQDSDSDGYGDTSSSTTSCTQPSGYVSTSGDCDDTDSAVYPGADEYCNGADDDCDGTIDEDTAVDAVLWYEDGDSDGYGNAAVTDTECYQPSGFVADNTDCDDTVASTYPGADEYCNGVDDDCDTVIDEDDAVDVATWYEDADSDGYGNAAVDDIDCSQPSGYVADNTDCDDTLASVYPGADEYCNSIDDDCDGSIDEDTAVDAVLWYADADSDGYGDAATTDTECYQPSGFVADNTDCDDTVTSTYPGADEYCNGVDDDCDTVIDEDDAVDVITWFQDADADGYGNPSVDDVDCDQPTGFVEDDTDCDDTDASIYPGATEIEYDGIDQDCDGEDLCDVDDDTFNAPECGGDDCDDEDADINVDAAEVWYDGVDQDCDELSDYDADYDGYDSESYGGEDCDDADPETYPEAPDEPYDGVINDCDDADEYDADGDGFDSADYGGDDCDDANSDINTGAAEVWYDGVDQDCDGEDDDQDGDGYPNAEDCDDTDPDSYPGSEGLDENCDEVEEDASGLGGDTADPAGADGGLDGATGGGGAACGDNKTGAGLGLLGLFALGLGGIRRRRD